MAVCVRKKLIDLKEGAFVILSPPLLRVTNERFIALREKGFKIPRLILIRESQVTAFYLDVFEIASQLCPSNTALITSVANSM